MRATIIRNLLFIGLGLASTFGLFAQDASREYVDQTGWSIGTTFGTTDMWGNVGTSSPITHYTNSHYTDKIVFMGGLLGRYTIHPCFSIRFEASFGTLYATDEWNYDAAKKATDMSNDAYQRYARHQDAKTYIGEGIALMEFEPFRANLDSKKASRRGQFYLTAGLGIMHFAPYTTVGQTAIWVNAQNLDLEGEGFGAGYPKQFATTVPVIPFGFGYRWDVGKRLNIGGEFLLRYTFTKYLDGVSGKYISDSAFIEHLSPQLAAQAIITADKGYQYSLEPPNTAGSLRGTGKTDLYSSITFTLSYKLVPPSRRWWNSHS